MNQFQIIIGSPVNYDQLVAYIRINGEQVALVSQEKGMDALEVEFFDEPMLRKVKLELLIAALNAAKTELLR